MADHVFETTSSQLLHSGKIFALRRDEVLMPGGATATRDVVEHFGAEYEEYQKSVPKFIPWARGGRRDTEQELVGTPCGVVNPEARTI